jgi:hypothetical protein
MEKDTASELILYGDVASQPSRAVFLFCEINKIPHER